jgi:two-component system chemotaxis response regulator CheY
MVLTNAGFEIIGMAKNGEEAVQMYKKFPSKPDVIIMDHRMPIMSGLEASKEILDFNKEAKIIFASGDKTIEEMARSIGAICFKSKPFSNEKLVANVHKALGMFPQINH